MHLLKCGLLSYSSQPGEYCHPVRPKAGRYYQAYLKDYFKLVTTSTTTSLFYC